jgi:hypothetical protein
MSLLELAAQQGRTDIVRRLLQYNANFNLMQVFLISLMLATLLAYDLRTNR